MGSALAGRAQRGTRRRPGSSRARRRPQAASARSRRGVAANGSSDSALAAAAAPDPSSRAARRRQPRGHPRRSDDAVARAPVQRLGPKPTYEQPRAAAATVATVEPCTPDDGSRTRPATVTTAARTTTRRRGAKRDPRRPTLGPSATCPCRPPRRPAAQSAPTSGSRPRRTTSTPCARRSRRPRSRRTRRRSRRSAPRTRRGRQADDGPDDRRDRRASRDRRWSPQRPPARLGDQDDEARLPQPRAARLCDRVHLRGRRDARAHGPRARRQRPCR